MLDKSTLIQRLMSIGRAHVGQLAGCSDEEIHILEDQFGVIFPATYKEFLRAVGRSGGRFWSEVDYTIERLPWINRDAREMLDSRDSTRTALALPSKGFVFSWRVEGEFLFFLADRQSEDPPIFRYGLGYEDFVLVSDTFSSAIFAEIDLLQQLYLKHPQAYLPWGE